MSVTIIGTSLYEDAEKRDCCGLSDRPGLWCSPEKDCCWC